MKDVEDRFKLGYEYHREMDAIRDELSREGVTGFWNIYWAAGQRYRERHKNDPSLRERQAAQKALAPKRQKTTSVFLTDSEVDYLIERLAGANHELGQSILAKLSPTQPKEPGRND